MPEHNGALFGSVTAIQHRPTLLPPRPDEQTKAAFLEIAKRWLDIALTYESGEQSIRLRKKRWQG